jgi:hypothetical protein
VIRVYDAAGNVIEMHEHAGDFKELRVTIDDSKNGRLESASALNQIDDQDDDSNYEQEVDQAAANVAEQAKKPEH